MIKVMTLRFGFLMNLSLELDAKRDYISILKRNMAEIKAVCTRIIFCFANEYLLLAKYLYTVKCTLASSRCKRNITTCAIGIMHLKLHEAKSKLKCF